VALHLQRQHETIFKQFLELELQPAHTVQLLRRSSVWGTTLHLFTGPQHHHALHLDLDQHRRPAPKLLDRPHLDGIMKAQSLPALNSGQCCCNEQLLHFRRKSPVFMEGTLTVL
jgi:hypothetical protein